MGNCTSPLSNSSSKNTKQGTPRKAPAISPADLFASLGCPCWREMPDFIKNLQPTRRHRLLERSHTPLHGSSHVLCALDDKTENIYS